MSTWIGIDVAAKTVDVASCQQGVISPTGTFPQSPAGHRQLIRRLELLKPQGVILEATGVYYLDLAVALDQAGLPVSVINPRSARRFAELKLVHTKTDSVDAGLLAEYGMRMTPRPWRAPDPLCLGLRDLGRQINRLIGTRTQAKNRLHALTVSSHTSRLLIEDEQSGIAMLDQRIRRLQHAAVELIEQSPELSRKYQCLIAGKGIGEVTAIALLAEFCVLPKQLKAPQVSRHAGLDVRLHQSGTSINRPARLSKAGNAYLRAALYMPAMSVIQHDPRAKAFYQSLVARGKKKKQALCAVMRKYLTGLWACFKYGEPFDSARLFAEPAPVT